SCAQCHDDNWGEKLAGAAIPQGHPTGYPLYRLEWQTLGSLQRRLRNCLFGMRAISYPFGAPEYVDLQLYLMWRARGLPVEPPAVRSYALHRRGFSLCPLHAASALTPVLAARGRSRLRAVKVVLRRRTPDAGLARGPPLGPLRRVAVPRARFEIAELLILHLVELAEELDDLLILVAMVIGDVVAWAVPQRAPNDRDLFL